MSDDASYKLCGALITSPQCKFGMVTPRTAPNPIYMAMYADLYARLARLLPNCCAPPKRIELALERTHGERSIFLDKGVANIKASGIILDYGAHIRHGSAKKKKEMIKAERFYASVLAKVSLGQLWFGCLSNRFKSNQITLNQTKLNQIKSNRIS